MSILLLTSPLHLLHDEVVRACVCGVVSHSLVHVSQRGQLRADGVHLLHDEVVRAHLAGEVRHGARQRHNVRLQPLEALVDALWFRERGGIIFEVFLYVILDYYVM